jgi:uncharacterized membrane protein
MEVARKKAVADRPLLAVMFWSHLFDLMLFSAALAVESLHHASGGINDAGNLFGIPGCHLSPLATYLVYLVMDLAILGLANWLFFRALQVASLSSSVPFLAFSSVFMVPLAFVILGEMPSVPDLAGVLLTVIGSVAMNRRFLGGGWLGPVRALFREKGSRYMLAVSFLLAFSSPLDKRLVLMTDVFRQSVVYGFGMCLFFLVLSMFNGESLIPVLKGGLAWIALAGMLDAGSLLLQFASYHYLDVVIVICIKRVGTVLSVIFGWLVFRERHIVDKLIASAVMFVGIVVLYVSITVKAAIITTAVTVAAMVTLLWITGRMNRAADGDKDVPRYASGRTND